MSGTFCLSFLCFNGQCIETIWNGKFTYVKRIRLDSGTSYTKSSVHTHYMFNIFDSNTKHEQKELHIRPNCSFQCLRYFFASSSSSFLPECCPHHRSYRHKRKYFNAYDARYAEMKKKKSESNEKEMKKKKKINLRNILPLSMPKYSSVH